MSPRGQIYFFGSRQNRVYVRRRKKRHSLNHVKEDKRRYFRRPCIHLNTLTAENKAQKHQSLPVACPMSFSTVTGSRQRGRVAF